MKIGIIGLGQVVLELMGRDCTAMGIMNRDSGSNEETIEFFNPGNKWIIKDMVHTVHLHKGEEKHIKFPDWDSILYRRGFYQIIDHFLDCVKINTIPSPSARDSLITHKICEEIVENLEENINY
ncbi:MAG: hypothetical protein ACOYVK_19225 [Bacillota bacterium]